MNCKRSLFVFLLFSICLSACTNKSTKNVQYQSLQKSNHAELASSVNKENINVEILLAHPIYETKTDQMTIKVKNKGLPLSFGESYNIEIFKDGSWYILPFKDNAAFSTIGIKLEQDQTYTSTISLKTLKYDLIPGRYRVIKSFYTEGKEVTLASSFELK